MWINNDDIIEKTINETDEIPEGFTKGRLKRTKKIDVLKDLVHREELIDYYIVKNHSYLETMEYFNLTVRKDLRLLLNYYKIAKSPKMSAKYAKRNIGAKQKKTAKENGLKNKEGGQLCRTAAEQRVYDRLIAEYFDVLYDELVDDRYPYYIDFYIKSLDLFIEYQGHPSHGTYPYIEGDLKSINEANRLYGKWRYTYLYRDTKKYQSALDVNLNFIRVYPKSSLEENYRFNDNKFIDIIKIIYESSHKI